MNNNEKENKPQGQEGSGSAENKGAPREEQMNRNAVNHDASSLSEEMGNDSQRMVNLRDMGSLSGRDDYAGGSGDDMSGEDTGKPTIR